MTILNTCFNKLSRAALITPLLFASQLAQAASCEFNVVDEWDAAYKAEITIVNDGEAFNDWELSWTLANDASFNNGWNASYNCSGSTCTATPPNWNPTIHSGQSYTFGFIADKSGSAADPNTVVSGTVCDGSPAVANGQVAWQLDGERSSVQYVSMKKDHTAENNTFLAAAGEPAALSGSITGSGDAVFAVDLNDVSTGVDTRNGRLLSFLFETEFLPTAYFRTTLDMAAINAMNSGDVLVQTVNGELSLHGVRQDLSAELLVAKLSDNDLSVSTIQPINIASSNFDMAAGIEALRVVANLSSVGEAVPVYLNLHYSANSDSNVDPVAMADAPADPSGLAGSFDDINMLANLTWLDNSNNETLWLVRRRPITDEGDGDWQTVAELAANSSSLDEGLPDTGEFDYKVIAINSGVPSLPSNVERVTVTEASQLVRGQHTYDEQCAGCHGSDGEGISSFPALNSERDVDDMIAYIVANMPLGDAAACDQQCAEDVATYIQTLWVTAPVCDTSITPVSYGARQLKILTQREYQNSVTDLIGIDTEVADGLSADSQVGFFTNNTHASVVASSYSNFLLVAEEVAQWSADRGFAPALSCSSINQDCADQLVTTLAPKIFRRPLTTDEAAAYQAIAGGDHTEGDIQAGIQLALEGLLSSPQFLYRHELGEANPDNNELDSDGYELTSYEMATFLAYTFTGTTPDQQLLDAAAADELRDEGNIIAQAQRLADNAKGVMSDFVGSWLGTAELEKSAKDEAVWPGFADLVPHMKEEINETFSNVMLDPAEQFASLYAGNYTYLNSTLANHYGVAGVTGDALQKVTTSDRGGVLASGAFMARWGEAVETSPILRSVRVRRRILCQDQPDPPAGTFAAREEKLAELSDFLQDPSTTNRDKYHRLTEDAPCTNCHTQYINPLGFGMEDFDTVGRIRTTDQNGNTIDANGELYAPLNYSDLDSVEPFSGTRELGTVLSGLESAQTCLPKQMFRYVMGVGDTEIDPANPEGPQLSDAEKSGYACAIDQLRDTMMSEGPRAMVEEFGWLQAVRYRKAWTRN